MAIPHATGLKTDFNLPKCDRTFEPGSSDSLTVLRAKRSEIKFFFVPKGRKCIDLALPFSDISMKNKDTKKILLYFNWKWSDPHLCQIYWSRFRSTFFEENIRLQSIKDPLKSVSASHLHMFSVAVVHMPRVRIMSHMKLTYSDEFTDRITMLSKSSLQTLRHLTWIVHFFAG